MSQHLYNIFTNIIKKNNLSHAYLFTWETNVNSHSFPYKLAKLILCHNKIEENNSLLPCNLCISCRYFDANTHPDFVVIKPDGNFIKLAQIRELLEKMPFKPVFNKRICLIEECHRLNLDSANTLLKTLEEPPLDNHFFLLSNQPDLLLQTIVSRCINIRINQSFDLTINDLNELNIPENLLNLLKYLGIYDKTQLIELMENNFLNIRNLLLNFVLMKEKTILHQMSLVNKLINSSLFDIIIRLLISIDRDIIVLSFNKHEYLLNPELKDFNRIFILEPIFLHASWLNEVKYLLDRNINKSLILEHALFFYVNISRGRLF